jgi:hypothetical protein
VAYYARKDKKIRATFIDNSVYFSYLVPPSVYTVRRAEKTGI